MTKCNCNRDYVNDDEHAPYCRDAMTSEIVAKVEEVKREPRPTLYIKLWPSHKTTGHYYSNNAVPVAFKPTVEPGDIEGTFIAIIPAEGKEARNLLNHSGCYILSSNPDVAHAEQMAYAQARAANEAARGNENTPKEKTCS